MISPKACEEVLKSKISIANFFLGLSKDIAIVEH